MLNSFEVFFFLFFKKKNLKNIQFACLDFSGRMVLVFEKLINHFQENSCSWHVELKDSKILIIKNFGSCKNNSEFYWFTHHFELEFFLLFNSWILCPGIVIDCVFSQGLNMANFFPLRKYKFLKIQLLFLDARQDDIF